MSVICPKISFYGIWTTWFSNCIRNSWNVSLYCWYIRHTNVNRDKNNNFNTKTNSLPLFHQSQSNQIYPKFTKTCERAGKRKISVLETHYFLLKLYKMICYVKSCFLRSLLFTILTILRLFSKISSPNTGCLDSLHSQRATLFIRLSAKNAANLISYRGVRRISA